MTPLRRTPDDGPTMGEEEIARWARELQAQRDHQSRYKGHPSTPMSIHPERKRLPKRTTEPVAAIQGELRCVHRWRLQEVSERHYVDGVPYVWAECACGAKREQKVIVEQDLTYHTPVGHGRWW